MTRRAPVAALVLAAAAASVPAQPRETISVEVRRGDTLSDIAARSLGNPERWRAIAAANPQLHDPHLIHEQEVVELRIWPLAATVTKVTGEAVLLRGGTTSPLLERQELRMGDTVRTAEGAQVFVLVGGRHRLTVEPSSEVAWHALFDWPPTKEEDVRVEVVSGRLSSAVEHLRASSTFRVDTQSAKASVQGTDFRARAEGQIALLEVHKGRVAQRAGAGKVEVGAGQGTRVAPGEPPLPPRQLLPPPAPSVSEDEVIVGRGEGARVMWSRVSGAAAYHVQLAADGAFEEIVAEAAATTEEILLRGIAPGRYFVRISTRDDVGLQGPPGSARSVVFVAP